MLYTVEVWHVLLSGSPAFLDNRWMVHANSCAALPHQLYACWQPRLCSSAYITRYGLAPQLPSQGALKIAYECDCYWVTRRCGAGACTKTHLHFTKVITDMKLHSFGLISLCVEFNQSMGRNVLYTPLFSRFWTRCGNSRFFWCFHCYKYT